jgi:hypothetical protein
MLVGDSCAVLWTMAHSQPSQVETPQVSFFVIARISHAGDRIVLGVEPLKLRNSEQMIFPLLCCHFSP